jgi:adenylate cyclase
MNGLIEPLGPRVAPDDSPNGLRGARPSVGCIAGTRARIFGDEQLLACEGENRFVTLLFSDMCRSLEATRDLHPEDAAAFINRLLVVMVDVIFENGGYVDRFRGDGALAVFGVPHAHEEDPERAIGAAMQIRARARWLELEVTAGINTGAVYVGPVGSERHHETMVIGPAVGLAARLQALAQPGQILVSEATQDLTRHAFEFTPLTRGVKGLAGPIVTYVVERGRQRPESD